MHYVMPMPTKRTPAKKSAKKKTAVKKTAAKKTSGSSRSLPKIKDLEAAANRVGASKELVKKPGSNNAPGIKSSAGSAPVIDLAKIWKNFVKWYQKQIGQK